MHTHHTHYVHTHACMHSHVHKLHTASITDKYIRTYAHTHVRTYIHTHATHTQPLWCHSCSTLGRAWVSMKGELAERSKAHSTFAANVSGHISDLITYTRTDALTHAHGGL